MIHHFVREILHGEKSPVYASAATIATLSSKIGDWFLNIKGLFEIIQDVGSTVVIVLTAAWWIALWINKLKTKKSIKHPPRD